MGSRVLVHTSPSRGHLFPIAPTLDELRRRGHEVVVRTLASEVEWLRARGFEADAMDPAIEALAHDDFLGRTPMTSLRRSVDVFARRAPLDAADLERALAEVDPDLLLVDVNAWGASAAAEASGRPWAMWCPYPLPLPSRDAPPFGPGLSPARGALGHLRDRLLRPLLVGPLERVLLPRLNEVRTSRGLAPIVDSRGLYAACPVLLYLTAEPFEYPRSDWPSNVVMIGPGAEDPPGEVPAWLDELTRPVVLVTTSSEFQDDGRLAEVAMQALAAEDVDVVVTVPAQDLDRFDPPTNARVVSFVPHGPVLERAVCAITHGGMGATQKALARGVPVCVVPFGRDQLEVARRVVVAGAGTRLPKGRLQPDRLRRAVHAAMDQREGAGRVARAFADAGGAATAVDRLESLLPSATTPA